MGCQTTVANGAKHKLQPMRFYSISDYNDAYFELKDRHKFQFYRSLFDSLPNSRLKGKYTVNGDTLILHFSTPDGYKILGSKAIIDTAANQITFLP